jgi:nitrite reductase/ring-hydroxylating ferredoxin subunit
MVGDMGVFRMPAALSHGPGRRRGQKINHEGNMMERNDTSRRSLLRLGMGTGVAAILSGCRLFGSRKADVVAQPQDHTVSLTPEESSALLAAEGSLLIQPQGLADKILVIHGRDGGLHAVSSICTHMGCDVRYDNDLGHIRCPCHGSQYGVDGHNIRGPAQRPLRQYAVRDSEGRIIISL